ncbi:alpha-mannosidase [Pengzhenrongella frigida]|uniref:Alpha-mannosidase n=1 Tax=Pengzhenrongella frigida TaxID=1259133 RepID=A0A4Q5N380_9MICO|nr:glycoside hydrolase family 38 C-terminal domain-containing protein [Cellulomonas sp. HLT2-17]RYV50461.1 alpha-mannosidase [Cellulomonas sp. HLT2-17]
MPEARQKNKLTQIEERIRRFVGERIEPQLYRARVPMDVTHRVVGGEPVSFEVGTSGEFAPLPVGSEWGRAWDTVWLHVRATVPATWGNGTAIRVGTKLEAVIDLGFTEAGPGFQAEGMAFSLQGEPLKGLSPWNHYVPLSGDAGESVDLWVEAAANPNVAGSDVVNFTPTPLGLWETAGEQLRYRLKVADIALLDEEVYELVQDITVLTGVMEEAASTSPRRWRIAGALERMINVLDPDDISGTAAAGRAELRAELDKPANASAHTVYATGHAHIDSAWLWPLRETVRKCARTFSNVLALMDTDDDFIFTCSSAQQFAWIKQFYPALFERIRKRVAEGRFVPVGGMWVESDTNIPSGESLVRQFTFGQRFFAEEFGVQCEEVWLPDSFGYSGALPQIAVGAGARWFFTQKLSWNRVNRMPHNTFRWEGHDGSTLFAHMPPIETYNAQLSAAELGYAENGFADHLSSSMSLAPFGWGDGGGGPTREMVAAARRSASLEGIPRVTMSSPATFFAAAEAENPEPAIWKGEMYLELHRGTYTSQARTKKGNRLCESLLREAELWAATAAVRTGSAYPSEVFDEAWRSVLLLQFHDILPGSSIAWVHHEAEETHARVAATLRASIDASLAALAGEGNQLLRFNAAPMPFEGIAALGAGARRPLANTPVVLERRESSIVISNEQLRVVIDEHGLLVALDDLRNDRSLFTPDRPGNLLQIHRDLPTEWDAWDLDDHYRQTVTDLDSVAEVTIATADETSVTVVVRRSFNDSTFEQRITVSRDSDTVSIETDVEWNEREKVLKLAFPLRLDALESTSETQFGHVARPTTTNTSWEEAKYEICAHRWLHVREGAYGVGVANATVYGHDVVRDRDRSGPMTVVRETLLRSPLFPDPEADQGKHSFVTVLAPGADILRTVSLGYEVTFPLRELLGHADVEPLVRIDGEGVVVETVKLADDGSGDVVVRLYESLGRRGLASVQGNFVYSAVLRTDLLEKPLTDASQSESLTAPDILRPFELVTLRFVRADNPEGGF